MRSIVLLMWASFFVVDLFIACSLAEVWTRLFIPVQNICYYHDPVLGDMRCPEQETYGYVEPGYSNILRTNSLGFHDLERSIEKSEQKIRFQYYGDSLISGVGVPCEKTIPSLVERNLNRIYPSLKVEVFNMAPAEDSTASQLLAYQNIGKAYSPDVVICHFMCDFRDNIFETHQRTRSPYFVFDKGNNLKFAPPVPVDMTTPVQRLKKSSLLVRHMANKLLASKFYHDLNTLKNNLRSFRFTNQKDDQVPEIKKYIQPTHKQLVEQILSTKSWPLTMRIIEEFRREVEKDGGHFILVDGKHFQPHTAGKYSNENLARFCKANDITYIPVFEEYQALKKAPPEKKYFLKDGHPTSLGNETLSKVVADKLNPQLKKIMAFREGLHDQ
jgi:hypothetical protein